MYESMLALLQKRHDLAPAVLSDVEAMLREVATGRPSRMLTVPDPLPTATLDRVGDDEPDNRDSERAWIEPTDRYEDLGLLGTGGMGEVRRVRDRDLNRIMAMKVIRAELTSHPKLLARFIEEAQCSAQLQHPGIVPVHELGRMADGRFYFTMAEVRGRTMTEVISEVHRASKGDRWERSSSGWTFRGLVDALHRVCEAVAYAHSRGVVHRDLKPDNIMLGAHGEVLVVDWGLAKVGGRAAIAAQAGEPDPVITDRSTDASNATRLGAIGGTPAYMPPERATGATDRVDARSDVYALGAILYEVMSGRPPYPGSSAQDVLEQVKSGPPSAPGRSVRHAETDGVALEDSVSLRAAARAPPLPTDLLAACERAMSRDPAGRFDNAGALASEVAAWLDGARRREQALAVVKQALGLETEIDALEAQAATLESEARELLSGVAAHEPEVRKLPGWQKEDKATALRREAERLGVQLEQGLAGALRIDPTLPEAHAALATRHLAAHEAAEKERATDAVIREAHRLRTHAEALPIEDETRRWCAVYLKGDGALSLVTEPAGAEVLLHRFEPHSRRLVPSFVRSLGRTPLEKVSLPMGSYLCVLRCKGRADVRYPVHIGRGLHWHGVPPEGGEPHPIWLPGHDDLGPHDCYVPPSWFTAGGDGEARNKLSRRRVWVDGFSISRFPVTNREYIEFIDDLVAQGREEEALRHAPRERAGTVDDLGALIYGFDGRRFSLRPDADGDVWLPAWPVCKVDWHGAVAFASWAAARTGLAWRLPHSLEWEKAARGVDGRLYPWGDGFDPSWCHMQDSHEGPMLPSLVGAYSVDESVYGVRDMAGNMIDWTGTVYRSDGVVFDGERATPRPGTSDPDSSRVSRGGSWFNPAAYAQVTNRYMESPGDVFDNLGFRLSRTLP